jgi:hypothetical protein
MDNNVIVNIPKSLDGTFYTMLNFDEIIKFIYLLLIIIVIY